MLTTKLHRGTSSYQIPLGWDCTDEGRYEPLFTTFRSRHEKVRLWIKAREMRVHRETWVRVRQMELEMEDSRVEIPW